MAYPCSPRTWATEAGLVYKVSPSLTLEVQSETLSQKTKQLGLEDLWDKSVIQDGTALQVKAKDSDVDG